MLQQLDAELREDVALDPSEGPQRLARHAMAEIARQLAGDEGADAQAIRLNDLLRRIVLDGDDWAQTEVVVPARVLSGIKSRSPLGAPVDLPPLPATPFSQSDLLVNAEGQPNIGSETESGAGDRGLRRPHLRLRDLDRSTQPPRVSRGRRSPRRRLRGDRVSRTSRRPSRWSR